MSDTDRVEWAEVCRWEDNMHANRRSTMIQPYDHVEEVARVKAAIDLAPGAVGLCEHAGSAAAFVRTENDIWVTDHLDASIDDLVHRTKHGASYLDSRGAPRVAIAAPGRSPVTIVDGQPDRPQHSADDKAVIVAAMEESPQGTLVIVGDVVHPYVADGLDLWLHTKAGWDALPCGPALFLRDLSDADIDELVESGEGEAPTITTVVAVITGRDTP